MRELTILGHHVTFNSETHEYTIDGEVVESATTLLGNTLFEGKYAGIPREILNKAAKWGSDLHFAIEKKMTFMLDDTQAKRYYEFWDIIEKENIAIVEQEQIVFYKHMETWAYIGTFDAVLMKDGKRYMADIKTTYQLDFEYLAWQLGLYRMAYEQMYNKKVDGLLVFWLPKRKKGSMKPVMMLINDEMLAEKRLFKE